MADPFASEVQRTLLMLGVKGKTILDIGARSGSHALEMVRLGASKVVAIDPDNSRFKEYEGSAGYNQIEFHKLTAQEYNPDFQFDVITIFLWNIPFSQYDPIMEAIKRLLKPDGTLLVGAIDDVYVSEEDSVSVPKLLRKHFNSVRLINKESMTYWQAKGQKNVGGGRRLKRKSRKRVKKLSFRRRR